MTIRRFLVGLMVLATIAEWPVAESAAQTFEGITAEAQAQAPQLPQQPRGGQKPELPAQPPGQPQAPPRPPIGSMRNIQVDVTIQSQGESGPPLSKVITMMVADGSSTSIRVQPAPVVGISENRRVNGDVTASTRDTKISLRLNLDVDIATDPSLKASLRYSGIATVFLDSGVMMIVSRAPDPTSERSISVEVKATILK